MGARPLRAGEQVLLVDGKDRRYLVRLDDGGEFHTHAGILAHDGDHRRRRGGPAPGQLRRDLPRHPAHAGRLRAEDAAGRAGHLPEGPRPDPDAGRHLPGRPGARVRRRVRRAVDDPAAGRGRDRRATSCGRTSPPGPRPTSGTSSATRRWPATGSRSGTATTGIDETDLDRIVLDLPEPWQVVTHAAKALRPRRDPRRLHPVDHPGQPAPRGPRPRRVLLGRDGRGPAAHLARRGRRRPARPPDGGPHRVPHPRPRPRLTVWDERSRRRWSCCSPCRRGWPPGAWASWPAPRRGSAWRPGSTSRPGSCLPPWTASTRPARPRPSSPWSPSWSAAASSARPSACSSVDGSGWPSPRAPLVGSTRPSARWPA